jgi:hypothetical protein
MARLFVTPREYDFFSDITKELIKDVNDQTIFYYAISESRTAASNVYGEAVKKVFDDPIEIEVLSDAPQWETKNDLFSADNVATIAVYVQHRDLVDKGITLQVGDFFSRGTVFYEITSVNLIKPMYGQIEHPDGYVINGLRSRSTIIDQKIVHGPTSQQYSDANAEQKLFVQQRGYAENILGQTNDLRALRKNGVLESPLTGQRQVSSNGTMSGAAESFYDE